MMETLNITNFRSQMAPSFNRVDAGEQVIVRRKNRLYSIVPIENDETIIHSLLQSKIDKARNEYKNGETLHFDSIQEMNAWLDKHGLINYGL